MFNEDLIKPNPVKTFRFEAFRSAIVKQRKEQRRMNKTQ